MLTIEFTGAQPDRLKQVSDSFRTALLAAGFGLAESPGSQIVASLNADNPVAMHHAVNTLRQAMGTTGATLAEDGLKVNGSNAHFTFNLGG